MSIIRDYGTLGGAGYTGASTNTGHYGQVYQATHQNNERLSYMKRSFISFTFSDPNYEHPEQTKLVHIEDFNLIVVFSNNRFERDGYTSFNDLTLRMIIQMDNTIGVPIIKLKLLPSNLLLMVWMKRCQKNFYIGFHLEFPVS